MAFLGGSLPAIGATLVGGPIAGAVVGGQSIAKRAAEKAGEAQVNVAREALQFQKEELEKQRQDRMQAYAIAATAALPSAAELSSIAALYKNNEAQFNQQLDQVNALQQALASAPMNIKEAGEQQFKIMKGETTAMLTPILGQRERAKQQLEQTLAERLGPGYKTSAAGILALQNFDDQTNLITNQAQQEHLRTLGQTQAQQAALFAGGVQVKEQVLQRQEQERMNQFLSQVQANQNISARRLQATSALGAPINLAGVSQAQQTLAEVVGNPFAGAIGFGKSLSNLGLAGARIAGNIAGAGMG